MNGLKKLVLIVLLLCASLGALIPTSAQSSCPSVVVVDIESSQKIDASVICQAAQPWVSAGFKVYVYITDFKPTSDKEWLDHIHRFQDTQDKLTSSEGFLKTAIVFQASTLKPNIFASSISIGKALFSTPLGDDGIRSRLKGQLSNLLEDGSATRAFAQVITNSYNTAFPSAAVQPQAQPPQQVPQIQPAQPTQQQQPRVVPQAQPIPTAIARPSVVSDHPGYDLTFGHSFIDIIIVLIGLFFLYIIIVKVIVPAEKSFAQRQKFANQIHAINTRVNHLLLACEKLLEGATVEDTVLYTLWKGNGGGLYHEKDIQVQHWLKSAKVTLDKSFELLHQLTTEKHPHMDEDHVRLWETLYVTVVGTLDRILKMNQSQQQQLLNPFSVVEEETIDDALVEQIKKALRELNTDETLQIGLLVVSPDQMNEQGILGYVDQVKNELSQLKEAREQAEPALKGVQESLDQFIAKFTFDDAVLSAKDATNFVQTSLNQGKEKLSSERFLDALTDANDAKQALESLPTIVALLYEKAALSNQRQSEMNAIVAEGFHLNDEIKSVIEEIVVDLHSAGDNIERGNFAAAKEAITEIDADSAHALQAIQTLKTHRQENITKLQKLTHDLEAAHKLATEVANAWAELLSYPPSNRESVSQGYENATALLKKLDDQEAIETANSMKVQDFAKADALLTAAFADLATAESQLEAVLHQLEHVHIAEKSAKDDYHVAQEELAKAATRRDQDNIKIDIDVDQMIMQATVLLTSTQKLITNREFISATESIKNARALAVKAYASADEQAKAVDHAFEELKSIKVNLSDHLRSVKEAAQSLPSAALTTNVTETQAAAQIGRNEAEKMERLIGAQEDKELLAVVNRTIAAYSTAIEFANHALSAINSASESYEHAREEAKSAIGSAASAISRARNAASDADAEGAGYSLLTKAQQISLSMPGDNASFEVLRQVVELAGSAEQYASKAENEARAQIQQVEEARRRKQQEEEDARRRQQEAEEEARRQRQQQIDRQRQEEEDRRRSEQASTTSSYSPSSTSSSYGERKD